MKLLKYKQIADDIRKAILDKKYKPGEQLALEREMCKTYGVSRITIKRAIDELVKSGLVVKRRGSGTFVKSLEAKEVRDLGQADQFSGFTATFPHSKVKTQVMKFDIVHPTEKVAAKLNLTTEDFVYDFIRVRILDDKPIVVEYTQMPIETIPGIKMDVLQSSIYQYIEKKLHFHIQSAHRTLHAVLPTDQEKEWLAIDKPMAILEVEQVSYLDNGAPFEYSMVHHRGDYGELRTVSLRKS